MGETHSCDGATHHGLFPTRHPVIRQGIDVDKQRFHYNDRRREDNPVKQPLIDDWSVLPPWGSSHHDGIDGINSERLAGGTYGKISDFR